MSDTYETQLDLIRAYRRENLSFDRIVSKLDAAILTPREIKKRGHWGTRVAGGMDWNAIAVLGTRIWWPMNLTVPAYRLIVQGYLAQHFADASLVVEVGCGAGVNAILFARTFLDCRVIATDHSEAALACVRELCEVAGVRNVVTRSLDLVEADLTFLDSEKRFGIYACGVLCALPDGGDTFLKALSAQSGAFDICAFEPISEQMGGPSLTPAGFYAKVGLSPNVWPAINAFVDRGARLVEAVPDFIGYSPLYSMSLIHLSRDAR
jgi:SAM-dependent methyltransferase